MSRNALIFCIGNSVYFIALACSPSREPLQRSSAEVYQEGREGLGVTIWPKRTRIEMGELFYVETRVQNVTVNPLSFWVHTGRFDGWVIETNEKGITGILETGASSGGPAIQKLAPGDAYQGVLSVSLKNNNAGGRDGPLPVLISLRAGFTPMDEPVKDFSLPELISLREGFTPIREKKTYWSNRVVLGIKPGKPK